MQSAELKSVFFDPERKRWPRIRAGAIGVGAVSFVFFAALVLAVLSNPVLQTIRLPAPTAVRRSGLAIKPKTPADLMKEKAFQRERAALMREIDREATSSQAIQASTPYTGYASYGFFVDWDDASLTSLKRNLPRLDAVVGEWLHLHDATGVLVPDNPERERQAVSFIRANKPVTRIFALVNDYDGRSWRGDLLVSVLHSPDARARLMGGLILYAAKGRYDGISLDFEGLPDGDQPLFTAFVQSLALKAKAAGLKVTVNVPADDPRFEYRRVAAAADASIVMAYDEHWSAGDPGPIASQSWFLDIVAKRSRDIPPAKLVLALGNYAYDWPKGKPAKEATFQEAVLIAKESEGDINLDDASMNPTFSYADDADATHQVWMLDAVTSFNQIAAAAAVKPAGFALWRLGSEDPDVWKFFGLKAAYDAKLASRLSTVDYGYDIDYEGDGEILKLSAVPQAGARRIIFDPDQGLITTEAFTAFPSAYVIDRYGAAAKKIALTFDDGPDPAYTPAILDALKRERVPATFFVIGANAEARPQLLRREFEEGHEIGSHTFTHPNIAELPPRALELELSASQRLIESLIGRQTLLFRPPYAEDVEPETTDQTAPLATTSRLGYLDVGMRIDPGDWRRPGADAIVDRTVAQAEAGRGDIVLLHDSGGDRSQTVAALPRLIGELKRRGYAFVLTSDLIGKTRDEVMPPVAPGERVQARLNFVSFHGISGLLSLIAFLGYVGIALGIIRSVFMSACAIIQSRRAFARRPSMAWQPSVAVIVPAFNEEDVVIRTVQSLLDAGHPPAFEIVVVDDGSTDATVRRLHEAFDGRPQVRIFSKENGGKPEALNFGIARTSAEIVICLDADTIFTRDCIQRLTEPFADPAVGAVAGNAKVGNRLNALTRLQALEYVTSQNLDRRAFSLMNCITVVPGAVGAWRRRLVLQAGGFSHRTLAEDADLTFTIREMGHRVIYEDRAIALTEAPDTLAGFLKQRFRWMYGTLQVAWVHKAGLFRREYGALGFVAIPNIILFQILFNFISPIMDVMLLSALLAAAMNASMHPGSFSMSELRYALGCFVLFTALDAASAFLAFAIEKEEDRRLLIWIFWQRFIYRQLMYYVAVSSFIAGLRGEAVGWNKVERKGTVQGASP